MDNAMDRLRNSKAVRMLFALALAFGLWPAASLTSATSAYASDADEPTVDVEGYVKAQADSAKVGEESDGFLWLSGKELHGTGHYLLVKHTYAQNLEAGDTIYTIMTDEEQMADKFIGIGRDYVQLYEIDGDADYYVAYLAPSKATGSADSIVDFQAALCGNDAQMVDGVELDAQAGLAYIPKSILETDAAKERGVQIQTLEPSSIGDGAEAEVEATIDNAKSGVTAVAKTQKIKAQRFDNSIEIPVATADTAANLSLSDMEITVNDGNIDFARQGEDGLESASYDPETGKLTLAVTPASTAQVSISIKGGGLFEPQKAYAVAPAEMNTLPNLQFDNMDLDNMWIGDTFRYDGAIYDAENWPSISWLRQNYLYLPNYDGRGWNTDANGKWVGGLEGSVSGSEDFYKIFLSAGSDELHDAQMISGWHTSDWGASVDFSYSGSFFRDYGRGDVDTLPGYCAHTAIGAGSSNSYSSRYDEGVNIHIPIICRVLAKGDDYVVLGFAQACIYTQAGYGAYKFKVQNKGDLEVQKYSGNPSITDGNSCYSLSGAVFSVYDGGGNWVCDMTTDSNGYAKATGLKAGSYTVRETSAPKGYKAGDGSGWSASCTVPGGGTAHLDCADQPGNDPDGVLLQKVDAETGEAVAQGDAKLALAEYTFEYYDGYFNTAEEAQASGEPARTWVLRTDEDGFCSMPFAEDSFEYKGKTYPYFVSGDPVFINNGGNPTVPLGTIITYESKAPEGYNLSDKTYISRVVMDGSGNVTTEGDAYAFDGNTGKPETVAAEQPKRGDLQFSKRDQETMKAMPNIPFLVTSKTTGERHVLVTDANGQFDSSAFDSSSTFNANDAALSGDESSGWKIDEAKLDPASGVWFGSTAKQSTAAGAFPFDEYSIEELAVSSNEGKQLVHDGFTIWRDAHSVDLGTIDDTTPTLITSAANAELGGKQLAVAPSQTFVDSVSISGLVKGDSYKLTTTLKDAATGQAIAMAGGKQSVETAFTADSPNMIVKTSGAFSTAELDGHAVVVCQALADAAGRGLATHEDLADEAQTLQVAPPVIGTTATDALDGDKNVVAMPGAQINDRVAYSGAAKGCEYALSAELRYVDTGEAVVDAQGNKAAGTAKFTAQAAEGTVDVKISFDGSNIAEGRQVVVYEKLYMGSRELAGHEDKGDAAQTVTMVKPKLSTTAQDAVDGDKNVVAQANASIVDEVAYEGVAPGVEHELRATLKYQSTGEAVKDASGNPVVATAKFTPLGPSGKTRVTLSFDGSNIDAAAKCVVAEQLFVAGTQIADHDDMGDEAQTVTMTKPRLSTTATDAVDGDKNVVAQANAKVIDEVAYEDVVPGQAYEIRGTLKYKDTGEVVEDAKGNPVEASAAFTAESVSGKARVVFEFDGSNIATSAKCVVAEQLFCAGSNLASHDDMADEAQTVTLTKPRLATTATDGFDGDKNVVAQTQARIVDEVAYDNCVPGTTYELRAALKYQDTGEQVIDAQGKRVEATGKFTAEAASGKTRIEMTFDGSNIAQGRKCTVAEQLWLEGFMLADHDDMTDEAQTATMTKPRIQTTATDGFDGDKNVVAMAGAEVIDEVAYENVVPGIAYELRATLKYKDSGEQVVDAKGNPVEASAVFIPEAASGKASVKMSFDGTNIDGDAKCVVAEQLWAAGSQLADHDDMADEAQTVTLVEPKIQTTAADALDGDKNVVAVSDAGVVDVVRYSDLRPGETYKLSAKLMWKDTGEQVENAAGNPVEATAEFTAPSAAGEAKVVFSFDGSGLEQDRVCVCFESLSFEGDEIANHEDIDDEDQTVTMVVPWASTQAKDAVGGGKVVSEDKQATVVDTVEFGNAAGAAMTAYGILVDPDTGLPILVGIDKSDEGAYPPGFVLNPPEEADGGDSAGDVPDAGDAADNDSGASTQAAEAAVPANPGEQVDGSDSEPGTGVDSNPDAKLDPETASVKQWWDGVLSAIGAETVTEVVPGELEGFEVRDSEDADWQPLGGGDAAGLATDGKSWTVFAQDGASYTLAQTENGSWSCVADHDGETTETMIPASLIRQVYGEPTQATRIVCRGAFDAAEAEAAFNAVPRYAAAAVTGAAAIPAVTAGSVEVSMQLDSTGMGGTGAVCYEIVAKDLGEGSLDVVASHMDASDYDQSVWFKDAEIGTTLTDSTDGDHEALNSKSLKLTDQIAYEGLIVGREYQVKGWLVDKETGDPVLVGDKRVEATAKFTPNEADGVTEVEFAFDASALAGKDAVAFEELWLDSDMVAEHKDIDDESQTVTITETPKGGFYDKTGGSMAWAFVLAALLGAGGVGFMAVSARRARLAAAAARPAAPAASPLD